MPVRARVGDCERAGALPESGSVVPAPGLGEAEVEHLHLAVRRQLDVRGLEVAVDDTLLVGLLERLGHLLRNRKGLLHGHRPALQPLGEVLAFDQLEHEEELAIRLLEAVDGGDAGVVERREQLRLAAEASQPLGVLRHLGREHLQRHFAPELRVGGAVHLAHAARAERGGEAVVCERLADQDRFPPMSGADGSAVAWGLTGDSNPSPRGRMAARESWPLPYSPAAPWPPSSWPASTWRGRGRAGSPPPPCWLSSRTWGGSRSTPSTWSSAATTSPCGAASDPTTAQPWTGSPTAGGCCSSTGLTPPASSPRRTTRPGVGRCSTTPCATAPGAPGSRRTAASCARSRTRSPTAARWAAPTSSTGAPRARPGAGGTGSPPRTPSTTCG